MCVCVITDLLKVNEGKQSEAFVCVSWEWLARAWAVYAWLLYEIEERDKVLEPVAIYTISVVD